MEVDAATAKHYVKDATFNQDLSIEVFNIFAKVIEAERLTRYEAKLAKYKIDKVEEPVVPRNGITIADALSTDGVRALRYVKETPCLRHIFVNNCQPDESAGKQFAQNVQRNGIDRSRATFTTHSKELNLFQFVDRPDGIDVIDLQSPPDQFHLIDAAVQAVALDGGLLCVTNSNIQTLVANQSESLFRLYGSQPIKTRFPQEHAIRVLLHAIDAAANRYKRSIQPWLSFSRNNTVRVYVRVFKSASGALQTLQNRAMLHYSPLCHSFFYNRLVDKNRLENACWIEDNDQPQAEADETDSRVPSLDAQTDLLGLQDSSSDATIDALFGSGDDSADANIDALFGGAPTQATTPSKQVNSHTHASQYRRARRAPTVMDLPALTGVPGHKWQSGGPIWVGPLHDQLIVDKLLGRFKTYDCTKIIRGDGNGRVRKPTTTKEQITLLAAVSDELKDVPFTYDLNMMCKTLQCGVPILLEVLSALQNAGYRASNFHANHLFVKTDAPSHIVSLLFVCCWQRLEVLNPIVGSVWFG